MKKILLVLVVLAAITAPVYAGRPEDKGAWYVVEGRVVKQEDLRFAEPAPGVEILMNEIPEFATRFTFFPVGNYYCAYNDGWEDYYICGANDGSNFFCKYYTDGSIECTRESK